MGEERATPKDVDAYIAGFPPAVRERLEALRATIRECAPEARESIAYRMPAYWLEGPLIYFAAHKAHLGLYALPEAIEAFAGRLSGYASSKGAIQFPFDRELPLELVADIVRFRVAENLAKAEAKQRAKGKGGRRSGPP